MNRKKKNLRQYVVAGCVALAAGACSFGMHAAEKNAKELAASDLSQEERELVAQRHGLMLEQRLYAALANFVTLKVQGVSNPEYELLRQEVLEKADKLEGEANKRIRELEGPIRE